MYNEAFNCHIQKGMKDAGGNLYFIFCKFCKSIFIALSILALAKYSKKIQYSPLGGETFFVGLCIFKSVCGGSLGDQQNKNQIIWSHLCQVKLVIVPAVVLAFIIVASGNDDVHGDHAQDEHVKHGGPH